ncbi:hypothetical protein, partial [Enterocloster clostridioformis]
LAIIIGLLMIIDFIIEDLMLNSYLQKNFHTLPFFWRMLITILATQIREAKNELKTTIKVLSKFEKRL